VISALPLSLTGNTRWNSSTGTNQAFHYPTLRKKRPTLTFLLEFQQRNQSSFYLVNSEKKGYLSFLAGIPAQEQIKLFITQL